MGTEKPGLIDVLPVGETAEVVGYYTVAAEDIVNYGVYDYVINDARATGENSRGRTAVISYAGVGILITE